MQLTDYWQAMSLNKYLKASEFAAAITQLNLDRTQAGHLQVEFLEGLRRCLAEHNASVTDDCTPKLAEEFAASFWERKNVKTQAGKGGVLTDEKILEISQNPLYSPLSTWWLCENIDLRSVQAANLRFARAVEALVLRSSSFLTDAEIQEITQDTTCAPVSIWWLREHVHLGDVQQATLLFARAIEAQVRIAKNPGH